MIKRGTKSQLFVEPLLSHSTEKFCRRTLLCFEKLCFWKKLWISGRGSHYFSSKSCCLTVPKNIVGEPICVSETIWYEMNLWIKRREVYVEHVLSHSTESFGRGTLLWFGNNLIFKYFMDIRGSEYHDLSSIFFVSQ